MMKRKTTKLFFVLLLLVLASCAPKFTVYIGFTDKINTEEISILSIDTVEVAGTKNLKVCYIEKKMAKGLEKALAKRRAKKLKIDIDKITKPEYIR